MLWARRIRRLRRWLRKKKCFFVTVLVLAALAAIYRLCIAWLGSYALRVAELEARIKDAPLDSPERLLVLSRQLELARLEPAFVALLVVIPASFALVAIIYLYQSDAGQSVKSIDSDEWLSKTREKRARFLRERGAGK